MQETKVNTGGPAFPIHWENHHQGITMRDYFAAKAMQGILANPRRHFIINASEITQQAYQVSDAMIEARSN